MDYKVIKNEWPYAIDHGYQHMIVWSRLKLLNPGLSKSPTQWHLALEQGLSGFVNLSEGMKRRLHSFNLLNKLKSSDSDDNLDHHSNPLAIEMIKFIKNRWFGYEDLMWFLNPVQLQSCPDLPHFHVFVKTQGWSEW
ncbi:uncharacterized protein MELLADRAFT_70387 [Melampsora larici-populina 98AG31]|uniref:Uncharacterized protein n=1 Tax=Melampsora larici-populina (strain 98AG31 / pathotype 3-4-7) TaxID=747676 RepID=F4R3B4_MELLP|nr:uncharacterized protein MELLADRAFT_70387 [Melampsora larici-populina 98AG31]EGG12598.1 hypothetical protein MELLADRAFT_70387 [Melampsora larici-populina 98AG31]